MFSNSFIFEPFESNFFHKLVCPSCKMDFETYKRTGRLGCNSCYTAFKENLSPIIKDYHGKNHHVGKVPSKYKASLDNINILKERLRISIEKENYEEAARLHDIIKRLESNKK